MPQRQYAYQYETSPRKIKPDYSKPKKNTNPNKSRSKVKKQEIKTNRNNQKNVKTKKKANGKIKFSIFIKFVIFFAIMFCVIFRNAKISEKFSQIQKLKTEITDTQKENDQLEINIQNSLNLNHIEQSAKELLGMQKLSNKQTVYISLPKKDYVEPRTEEIIIEESKNLIQTIIEKIKSIF